MSEYKFVVEKTAAKGLGQFMWITNPDDFDQMLLAQMQRDNSLQLSRKEFADIDRIAAKICDRLNKKRDSTTGCS